MHTEKRLDRVVCNQEWLDTCCLSSVSTRVKHQTNHHFPLLIDFQFSSISFASNFKFLRMWSLHPDCRSVILDCWNTVVIGCPMFILSSKLKLLKNKLKDWNKNCFGNVNDSVSSAESNLQHLQDQIQQNGPSDVLLAQEKIANISLEDALNKQEVFWQEKSKLN
jgi:hypothetical protein